MVSENKSSAAIKLILVIFMSLSICQTLYTSLFMTYSLNLTIAIAVTPLTLLFFLMFKNRVTSIVSGSVLCISVATAILYAANAGNWLFDYFSWFVDVCNGFSDTSKQQYTNLTIMIMAFIVTLFVFIFTFKFYNFYIISLMLFSVFFVQLQLNIFVSNISFVLFIFSFLMYYFFDVLRRRSKHSSYDVGSRLNYMICIIPVCIIVIAVSFLLPVKDARTALPWLDARFDSVVNRVVDYFSNADLSDFDYFSIDAAGFGKDDRLGGNISLSKTHVMNVKSLYPNLYLKASSKAFYNGHSWYNENNELTSIAKDLSLYKSEVSSDSGELSIGISKLAKYTGDGNEIFKYAKAEIEFANLRTKSIFIPSKLNTLTFKKPQNLFYDTEQMISSGNLLSKGLAYTVEYDYLMLNTEDFKKKVRNSYKGFISTQLQKIIVDKKIDDSNDTLSKYIDRIKNNYSKYTKLPDTITPRVRKLAVDITKDKTNTYDKCKAVETYLSNNYPYTLKPGNPPRKKDFVDYFLFEGKKGYCTYYASAMTVLLRCIDIPARYVEGYILPPEADKNSVFKVTNQQAHAWVEVYFEGFGWIPFEPTAPFVANLYNDRTISAKATVDMQGSAYVDYMDMINKYRDKNARVSYNTNSFNSTEQKKTSTTFTTIIKVILVAVLILLAFIILVLLNYFKYYFTITKIRKADPNDSVLLAYSYILKVLKILNISYNTGETPTDFGKRVEKTLNFGSYSFNKIDFNIITDDFVKARYSKVLLPSNTKQDVLNFINIILKLEKERIGKFKFLIARFIFGKM